MCNPLAFMAVGTGMAVAGQLGQGDAAAAAANAQADSLDYQAAVERDNAQVEASRIRRAGRRARGEVLAGVAASGIRVGEGSALDVEREVMTDYETDAAMAILNGERAARGLSIDATMTRRAGRNARRASQIGAFTSLLGAGAQAASMGMFGSYNYNGDASGLTHSRSGADILARR